MGATQDRPRPKPQELETNWLYCNNDKEMNSILNILLKLFIYLLIKPPIKVFYD